MEAGKVYEFSIGNYDESKTFSYMADEIVSKLKSELNVDSFWVTAHRNNHNNRCCILIALPNADFTIENTKFFLELDIDTNSLDTVSGWGGTKGLEVKTYQNISPINGYNKRASDFSIQSTAPLFLNGDAISYNGYPIGINIGVNYGALFKFDTTLWTEENKCYQFSTCSLNNNSAEINYLTEDYKKEYVSPTLFAQVLDNSSNEYKNIVLGPSVRSVDYSNGNDITYIIDYEHHGTISMINENIDNTKVTLRKIFDGNYINNNLFYVNLDKNKVLKEYLSYSNLPKINGDRRILKTLEDDFELLYPNFQTYNDGHWVGLAVKK